MSDDGKNILAATRQVRGLFEEISKLLSTADAMMRELGWEPRAANTCIAGGSTSILWPKYWMPYSIFRFFRHKDVPHVLAAATVILDGEDQALDRVTEPLISGIVYDYGKGHEVGNEWKYDFASWHIYNKAALDHGTIFSVDPKEAWPGEEVPPARLTSFALPLANITNSGVLKEQVVSILDGIARQRR